jgi:glycosyltransferase involved in cell wall biosynthesis
MSDFISKLLKPAPAGATNPAKSGRRHAEATGPIEIPPVSAAHPHAHEMGVIRQHELFDEKFYLLNYPDIAEAGINPLEHFFDFGFLEGRKPNFYFDPKWYLDTHADVRKVGVQPLYHYASHGDFEGRRPSLLFDPAWYRAQYGLADDQLALEHFLRHRASGRFSPLPDFDIEYYASANPDVAAAGVDAFEHFLLFGYREGRNPSADFDVRYYSERYLRGDLAENPFLHYIAHKHEPGVYGRLPHDEATIPREIKRFTQPGPDFQEYRPLSPAATRRAKLLAYYLPQFHAFAENDAWWGKGFTEWTNIVRGVPRFKGHYQPRVPRDLGFYALDSVEPLRRQAEMAKGAGIHGFVFYYYWFNGKRLLDKPLEAFLEDRGIEMPFCLMWANENWTRRWDGAESEVLISQDYRPDDEERLTADFVRHFADPRYIRIEGRPLLMVYRPSLIPDTVRTIARWRVLFRERHQEDPILLMAQAFKDTDPTLYGLDGAIEFPPHKLTQRLPAVNAELDYLDVEFAGKAYRYDDVVRTSLEEPEPAYPLIKTVVPGWDNDARRQGAGLVIVGSTPTKYESWLSQLVDRAERNPFFGEAFVGINAWNEWCEAAYLEPDLHFGGAYLNATGRAVTAPRRRAAASHLLLVGHDAFPAGAQHLLLNLGRVLRRRFGVEIAFLLLGDGKLEEAYGAVAPVTVITSDALLRRQIKALAESGFANAIVNTTAAGRAVLPLIKAGIEPVVLVHELPRIIREKGLETEARAVLEGARQIVFPAAFVRDQWATALGTEPDDRMLLLPQGSYRKVTVSPAGRERIRRELGLAEDAYLVIGLGYADLRKGFDLFLQLWRILHYANDMDVHLCWVGDIDPTLRDWLANETADAQASGSFHMVGYRPNVPDYLSAADAFVLPSREDPFPTVVLEALDAGLPVFAFDRSGGIPDMLREYDAGTVVPMGDVVAMANAVTSALADGSSEDERAARHALVAARFDFGDYAGRLLHLAMPQLAAISVAVPNYNYARFMPERLGSVFEQSHPVEEILVLDDCSTDDSLTVIPAVAAEWDREVTLLPNEKNSGSVFAQWRKAAETARGDYLWIAEADDLSSPDFLARMLAVMTEDEAVQFAFSDSSTIESDGTPLWASYKEYYATVAPGALSQSELFEAGDFVRQFLSVKNLILNASAVVWRREALLAALDGCQADLGSYSMAGDWRLYLQALARPGARVAYVAETLNTHRRHAASVTHALDAKRHVAEIARCHAFAREAFALSGGIEKAQSAYLKEVTKQLAGKPDKAETKKTEKKREKVQKKRGSKAERDR